MKLSRKSFSHLFHVPFLYKQELITQKRWNKTHQLTILSFMRTATARFLREQNVAALLSGHDFAFSTCNPSCSYLSADQSGEL